MLFPSVLLWEIIWPNRTFCALFGIMARSLKQSATDELALLQDGA